MAGDIFQKTFGDEGWNKDLLLKTPAAKNVNRNPALDGVANQIAEREHEAEMAEYNEKYGF